MEKIIKYIGFSLLIGVFIFGIGNYFQGGFQNKSNEDLMVSLVLNLLYSLVLGFSNLYFFNYLEKRNWEENKPWKRIFVGIFGSIMITLIGLFFLRLGTKIYFLNSSVQQFLAAEKWSNYSFGLWITSTIVISFHVFYFIKKNQDKKVKESQIVAKTETAKFESLKNQLDPHFLFNSLNVLTALIGENPKQAEKFTTKLSKVYRYVLEQKDKDLISVEEELQFAKSYMTLLQMRFEDALHFTIPDSISNPELKIVPLSLQILLENAVKHNVITTKNPLVITIYEENGYLVVENNINPKTSLEKSTKVGLQNIKNRYQLISKMQVEITTINQVFRVKLPLLTQKIQKMETNYLNESQRYLRAKKQVDQLKGFYWSLTSYCIVMPFLIFINYRTNWNYQWFWYPLFGWGAGILFKAIYIFGLPKNWEDKKIKEYMDKDNF